MAGTTILLIDDEDATRSRTAESLEVADEDFEVQTATDGAETTNLLTPELDCVVIATPGPLRDRVALIRDIRDERPTVPIILFEEHETEHGDREALALTVTAAIAADGHADPYSALADRIAAAVAEARAEQRARRERGRAEQYFDRAGAIILALAPDGRIERINEQGAAVLGYAPGELEGRNWFEVAIPPEERERTRTVFDGLLAEAVEEYAVVRNQIVTASGDRKTIEWQNNVLRDDTGAVDGTLSTGRDVTEQQAQATALEAERDRFVALFENVPEPAIVASFEDGSPIVRRVNQAFERVFGYDPHDVVGEDIDSYIVPADDEEIASDLNQELLEGNPVQAEATRLTASGPREFRLHVVPLKPGTENVEGYAIYEDITEIKDRERVLEGLHGAATEIVGADSPTAACERTIEAAEEILQLDLCEISLESDGYLVPTASSAGIDDDVPAAIPVEEGIAGKTYLSGSSSVFEDIDDHPEAEPQGPWRAALSVPIGRHGIFQAAAKEPGAFDETDLELAELLLSHTEETLTRLEKESELRDREAVLREQNERLEKFTNVLSHDLRNPLNVAAGELELARADRDDEHLEKVAQAQQRMRELIEDVLTLARTDSMVSAAEPIHLRSTAEACFQNVETDRATVRVETDRVIMGDPGLVQSMLENLFRNAVEHGRSDVIITVGEKGDGFYVADDGPGIPTEERESVLEAGFTTGENGTGLGLSIVAEVAEAHGWEMTLTESEGGGARFEFGGVDVIEEPPESPEE